MAEYRRMTEAESEAFHEVLLYAFDLIEGPWDLDEQAQDRLRNRWPFGERRGLYDEDGTLLTACRHLEFETRVRGEWLPMAGLSAVATPPEHRRRGLVRELVRESLGEYRERGMAISALWPFDRSFYRDLGWGTACRYTSATVPPDALAPAREFASGSFRRVDADDHAELDRVYETWLDGHTLATRRSAGWWRDRVFQRVKDRLYGYCWEREGEPAGYLLYSVDESDDGRRFRVYEAGYADEEAYLNLLRFCANHDSQVDEITLFGPEHDRLLDLVDDESDLTVEVSVGPMVRIVDVRAALEALPYPLVEDTLTVTVAVEDPLAGWNDDTFEITVGEGTAAVEPSEDVPDATIDVATLSQLFVGYLSARDVRMFGDLVVEREDVLETLDALFPPEDVFLADGF